MFFNMVSRNEGNITIDDQNLRDISIESLRKNISLVSQDVILFDDSVMANISYANLEASKEKIIEATKFAAAYDFIKELHNKIIPWNTIRYIF